MAFRFDFTGGDLDELETGDTSVSALAPNMNLASMSGPQTASGAEIAADDYAEVPLSELVSAAHPRSH